MSSRAVPSPAARRAREAARPCPAKLRERALAPSGPRASDRRSRRCVRRRRARPVPPEDAASSASARGSLRCAAPGTCGAPGAGGASPAGYARSIDLRSAHASCAAVRLRRAATIARAIRPRVPFLAVRAQHADELVFGVGVHDVGRRDRTATGPCACRADRRSGTRTRATAVSICIDDIPRSSRMPSTASMSWLVRIHARSAKSPWTSFTDRGTD